MVFVKPGWENLRILSNPPFVKTCLPIEKPASG